MGLFWDNPRGRIYQRKKAEPFGCAFFFFTGGVGRQNRDRFRGTSPAYSYLYLLCRISTSSFGLYPVIMLFSEPLIANSDI